MEDKDEIVDMDIEVQKEIEEVHDTDKVEHPLEEIKDELHDKKKETE